MRRFKKRIYEILEPAGGGDWQSRVFDCFILSLIVLNVGAVEFVVDALCGFLVRERGDDAHIVRVVGLKRSFYFHDFLLSFVALSPRGPPWATVHRVCEIHCVEPFHGVLLTTGVVPEGDRAMKLDDSKRMLQKLDELFEQGFADTSARRDRWREVAETIIVPTLEGICAELSRIGNYRAIHVTRDRPMENLEAVNLVLGNVANGIRVQDGSGMAVGVEVGAALGFCLADHARVVVRAYPFHNSLPRESVGSRPYFIGKCYDDPAEITPEDIYEIVASFLRWALKHSVFAPTKRSKIPKAGPSIEWVPDHEFDLAALLPREPIGFRPPERACESGEA